MNCEIKQHWDKHLQIWICEWCRLSKWQLWDTCTYTCLHIFVEISTNIFSILQIKLIKSLLKIIYIMVYCKIMYTYPPKVFLDSIFVDSVFCEDFTLKWTKTCALWNKFTAPDTLSLTNKDNKGKAIKI
jgi:hypothetical protein